MVDFGKTKITKIYFKKCELTNIPKELTMRFSNLINLDASSIRLARLMNYDFVEYTRIKFLNVSFNHISSLVKKGIPIFMNKLISLDMSHNVIDRIDDDVFTYYEDFKILNLSYNHIEKIGFEFLKSVRGLEVLKLDNNRIKEIYGDSDDLRMISLKELHLQNNKLIIFNPWIIPSASYLDLNQNKIFEYLDFSINNLNELYINNNQLEGIKINQNLLILDISSNTYSTNFDINFNDNKVLQKLILSNLGNQNYVKYLKYLPQLHNLTYLDISQNKLEKFDFNSANLPKTLQTLIMLLCEIHSLTGYENFEKVLPNLKSIDIRGNNLHCDDMKDFVTKVNKSLLVRFNELESADDYIKTHCNSEHFIHKEKDLLRQIEEKGSNKVLWAFVIIMLLGYVIQALYFINERFNVAEKIRERTIGNRNSHHSFTNC